MLFLVGYMDKKLELLQEIRKNPRRMHTSYLEKNGLFAYILEETSTVPEDWNNRDRIDYILAGKVSLSCYCGKICKPGKEFCSAGCVGRAPQFKEKMAETQRNNAKERTEKARKTYLTKYGVSWNNQLPGVKESKKKKRDEKKLQKTIELFTSKGLDYYIFDNPQYLSDIRNKCKSLTELSEKYFNGLSQVFIQRFYSARNVETYSKTGSFSEEEINQFIESLGFKTKRNDRTIIKPYEIDILIEEKKLAIEFDGLDGFNINAHLEKTELANLSGYDLIHIFEQDWVSKREIVKSILRSKLGKSDRIYARKCTTKEISAKEARPFLEETHLQGFVAASNYIGLFHEDELVMLITLGKSRFDKKYNLELFRFSTKLNTTVVGGFSKLLSYVRKNITGEKILTYCDRKYSNGNTYSKFGKKIGTSSPGYKWYSMTEEYSRYQTQKKKLKSLLPEHYSDSKSEKEIMESAGYYQMYDCGNLIFEV